jgi:UDP-N-acetylmuramate dehydrogenase
MKVYINEPMSAHTTFRTGGPADRYCIPDDTDELRKLVLECREENIPYYVIGNGSNLLVSDAGYRGCIIEIGKGISSILCDGQTITAGAGALLAVISQEAKNHALTGMEFASGIPGSLGGAVVMNAGAYGGEMKNILRSVLLMDENGRFFRETPEELELSYRHSNIPDRNLIVLEAEICLTPGDKEEIAAAMRTLAEQRREKQPLEYPSAGSTFKRPEGYYAGKLISDAGLKGYTVGGAMVSEKHAGFVINKGGASSGDILAVIDHVTKVVQDRFGVVLEPEVKILGEI